MMISALAIATLLTLAPGHIQLPVNHSFDDEIVGQEFKHGGVVATHAFGLHWMVLELEEDENLHYQFRKVRTGHLRIQLKVGFEEIHSGSFIRVQSAEFCDPAGAGMRTWGGGHLSGPGFDTWLGWASEPNTIVMDLYPDKQFYTLSNPRYPQAELVEHPFSCYEDGISHVYIRKFHGGMAVDNVRITWEAWPGLTLPTLPR